MALEKILIDKKVYVFDLDGTLIDSVSVWNEIDKLLLKQLVNVDLDESTISYERDEVIAKSTADDPYIDYVNYLVKKYNINMTLEYVINYRVNLTNWYLINKVMPTAYAKDLIELLIELKKKIVLATTTNMRCVNIYMNDNAYTKCLQLDKFDLKLAFQDVKKFKPDPEIHLKAMEILGYSAEEAVVFEDSFNGCKSALNAGIEVVAVKEKHSLNRKNEIKKVADYYVESLEEVYNTLKKIYKEQ